MTGYSQRRALLLSDCLGNGGLERQLGLLAANIESPWTAEVLAIDGGVYEAWLREHGVRVRVCGRRGRLDVSPAFTMWEVIREYRPDVVHSWGWMSSLTAGAICRARSIPFIDGTIRQGQRPTRRRLAHAIALRFADRTIANSEAGLRAWRIDQQKGRVVRNGFDWARLSSPPSARANGGHRPRAVMAARMTREKDFDTLVAAARLMARTGRPEWSFVLVGGGPDRRRIERESGDLVASGLVQVVPETVDAVPIMQAADVGILLTDPRYHAEGCANVLLEYMACALPVVCSRGGGNAEVVIGGRTGFIVPPLNPEAVVSALNDLADVNRRVALGSAGRSRVEAEFSVARLVSDTVAVYEELVARS